MKRVLASLALALVATMGSCADDPSKGYSFKSTYREDVKTVAVPVFDNGSFEHGLEAELTDAIIKEIHRTTPWRVTTRDNADTTLSGAITNVDMRKLGTAHRSGLVQELAYEMTVRFEWKENRSGQVLVARKNFRSAESFVPSRGAGERQEIGRRAAVDELAQDIVAELRGSW